ncbi:MAG TPA: class I SAM-dependent methyltransferase [Thermoanaerobaculia bacterium]|nr:class I SAM-dependent methyltransferase [Thermoanaerobaculia bacterium]
MTRSDENLDPSVVRSFGEEWSEYDQTNLVGPDYEQQFAGYFHIFPWERLPANAEGFDLGCGSGRWARGVAPRVGRLHCIDPSDALEVARRALRDQPNCVFHRTGVSHMPIADESMDFGYSLGVLHHLPDPAAGMRDCARKLKKDAPFLVYLYYAFDNQPRWYRWMWAATELGRRTISRLPRRARVAVTRVIAATVYWPLARMARVLEKLKIPIKSFPLSIYRDRTYYSMRTDALDRFGTRLEHRFTRAQIEAMMRNAGLTDIRFSDHAPYWCAVGLRAPVDAPYS